MSSSELSDVSSLSSAQSIASDDEILAPPTKGKIDHYFKNGAFDPTAGPPPPKRKRDPSPPHEYVLADNEDIAFIVMFRSRFGPAFPKSLPHFGPQDIERGVLDAVPDENVERLLCALIGLVLNRKKEVERGHHLRALEEAVQFHRSSWPASWEGKSPIKAGESFNTMTPQLRLSFLKQLILWSLNSSDAVANIIKESYKQQRHEDDQNQPLSVQPWGKDGDKRRYWLVEGQDDTHFRLYRESNPALKTHTWWSVAASIEDLNLVATKLDDDGSQAARKLKERILSAIPRFEAGEEKRKRRDYRQQRKQQFRRPEPGFSMYEGRTRGKRMKYTYSDEEDGTSDGDSVRRSTRHSGVATPADGPTFTASGRQVRSRVGGAYGESLLAVRHDEGTRGSSETRNGDPGAEGDDEDGGPVMRTRGGRSTSRRAQYANGLDDSDDSDEESDVESEAHNWEADDDEDEDEDEDDHLAEDEVDEDAEMGESGDDDDNSTRRRSLVVSLRYSKKGVNGTPNGNMQSSPLPPVEENKFAVMKQENEPAKPKNGFATHGPDEDTIVVESKCLQASANGAAEEGPATAAANGVGNHDAMEVY